MRPAGPHCFLILEELAIALAKFSTKEIAHEVVHWLKLCCYLARYLPVRGFRFIVDSSRPARLARAAAAGPFSDCRRRALPVAPVPDDCARRGNEPASAGKPVAICSSAGGGGRV